MKTLSFLILIIISLIGCGSFEDDYVTKWKDGKVPYVISGNFTEKELGTIYRAMITWQSVCNIEFKPATKDFDKALWIMKNTKDNLNLATTGYNEDFNFTKLCNYVQYNTALHELGHVIGLEHEHQRIDRDLYISDSLSNLNSNYNAITNYVYKTSKIYNMTKYPYDLKSIMHYNIKRMETGTLLAQELSIYDILKVQDIYGKPNKRNMLLGLLK